MMYGADPDTPIGVVENASRPDERIIDTTHASQPDDLAEAGLTRPAVILLGLASRAAVVQSAREIAL
jgi:uroporphyrin-III C-methyltransferase/precorrin-2 dehydrogenase/sirohydrochlorin ferrochelatase